MRIIAGSLRGRRLTPPSDRNSRPTADRAREALFSILTSRDAIPQGGRVLDCFAGTGALGLEALSRGAGHATFVEHHPAALKVLQANIRDLGQDQACTILKADAIKLPLAPLACSLVFMDPPYHQTLIVPCLQALQTRGWVAPGATIVAEMAADEDIQPPPGFQVEDERRYGAAKILILLGD